MNRQTYDEKSANRMERGAGSACSIVFDSSDQI